MAQPGYKGLTLEVREGDVRRAIELAALILAGTQAQPGGMAASTVAGLTQGDEEPRLTALVPSKSRGPTSSTPRRLGRHGGSLASQTSGEHFEGKKEPLRGRVDACTPIGHGIEGVAYCVTNTPLVTLASTRHA